MTPITIPPLVIWAIGVVGAAALARFVKSEWQRVNAELHPREGDRVDRRRIPTLRRDPKTGVYRVG
jgi:hypothetical protein